MYIYSYIIINIRTSEQCIHSLQNPGLHPISSLIELSVHISKRTVSHQYDFKKALLMTVGRNPSHLKNSEDLLLLQLIYHIQKAGMNNFLNGPQYA